MGLHQYYEYPRAINEVDRRKLTENTAKTAGIFIFSHISVFILPVRALILFRPTISLFHFICWSCKMVSPIQKCCMGILFTEIYVKFSKIIPKIRNNGSKTKELSRAPTMSIMDHLRFFIMHIKLNPQPEGFGKQRKTHDFTTNSTSEAIKKTPCIPYGFICP